MHSVREIRTCRPWNCKGAWRLIKDPLWSGHARLHNAEAFTGVPKLPKQEIHVRYDIQITPFMGRSASQSIWLMPVGERTYRSPRSPSPKNHPQHVQAKGLRGAFKSGAAARLLTFCSAPKWTTNTMDPRQDAEPQAIYRLVRRSLAPGR